MRLGRHTWSLWARALTYMFLIGGAWLVILPMLLLRCEHSHPAVQLRSIVYLLIGATLFLSGTFMALVSGYYLIAWGKGTPFPLDPTRKLVTCGPYRYVRNPQGIAMLLLSAGEVVAVRSSLLCLMLPLTLVYLEGVAGPWEDREMTRRHGELYLDYKLRVRKWLPKVSNKL